MSGLDAAQAVTSLRLLCDCLSVGPQPEQNEELRQKIAGRDVNWECLFRLAGVHLVTPSLAGALRRKGVLELLDEEVRSYVQSIESLNRTRNDTLRRELVRASRALNGMGVTPLLLKGAIALTPGQYPGASDRVIGDLDMVVPAERAHDAQHVMVQLGYREATEHWRRMTGGSKLAMHHLVPLVHPTLPVSIELHHRILYDKQTRASGGFSPRSGFSWPTAPKPSCPMPLPGCGTISSIRRLVTAWPHAGWPIYVSCSSTPVSQRTTSTKTTWNSSGLPQDRSTCHDSRSTVPSPNLGLVRHFQVV